MSFSIGIVDISTKGMQRSTTLFEMLTTSNFSATNTTGNGDLDTLGTRTHCRSNSILDGTTVLDTAFDLFGNILSHQDSIHLRAFHLTDVDLNILTGKFLELFTKFVNLRTSTTDNQTRTSRIDSHGEQFQGTLNVNLRDTRFGKAGVEVLTNLIILNEFLFKSSSTVPVRIPSADDT